MDDDEDISVLGLEKEIKLSPAERRARVRPITPQKWLEESCVNHRLVDDPVEYDDPNWNLDRIRNVMEISKSHDHKKNKRFALKQRKAFAITGVVMKNYNDKTFNEDQVELRMKKVTDERQLPQLGYWDHRGLAHPIRLILAYAEFSYEEKSYSFGPPPSNDRHEWDDVKNTLGLEIPRMPYYIYKDTRLSGCLSIIRYFAEKFDLLPQNAEEEARVHLAEYHCYDLMQKLSDLVHNPDFEHEKQTHANKVNLVYFAEFLHERYWIAGLRITYVDFIMYEVLKQHSFIKGIGMERYPNLYRYMRRIEELPTIYKYLISDAYKKKMYPLHGDRAYFGSKYTDRPDSLTLK